MLSIIGHRIPITITTVITMIAVSAAATAAAWRRISGAIVADRRRSIRARNAGVARRRADSDAAAAITMATSDAIRRRRTVLTAVDYFITAMMPSVAVDTYCFGDVTKTDARRQIVGTFRLKSSVLGHAVIHKRR